MKSRSRRVIAMALVATSVAMVSPSANGAALGGRWSSPSYSYYKNLSGFGGYDTAVTNAGNSWGASTKFRVTLAPPTSASVSLTVSNYGATDWLGLGTPGPTWYAGTYTYGSIQINAGWLNTRHFNCTTLGAATCQFPAESESQGCLRRRLTTVSQH